MIRSRQSLQCLAFALLAAVAAWAQPSAGAGAALNAHTQVHAKLQSSLNTAKAHVGQHVQAVTTAAVRSHGKIVIPKGTRLNGEVTSVQAAANAHSRAALGVVFNQAMIHNQAQAVHLEIAGFMAPAPYARFDGAGMAASPMLNGGAGAAASAASGMSAATTPSANGAGSAAAAGGMGAGLGAAPSAGIASGVGSTVGAATAAGGSVAGSMTGSAGAAGSAAASAGSSAASAAGSNGAAGLSIAAGAPGAAFQASNGALVKIMPPALTDAHTSTAAAALLVSPSGNFTLNSGSQLELTVPASASASGSASGSASATAAN